MLFAMWFLYWLRMQRLRFNMKTFSMNENDKTNEADEQLLEDARADAIDYFTQSDNDTWEEKHNLYNGYHPIIGGGAGSGVMGSHPARRHDDVYGKDVNGIGLSPFEPKFGEGTQNENTEGDHAVNWRNRLLEGTENLDESDGLDGWKKVRSGRTKTIRYQCKKTGNWLEKIRHVMKWIYEGDEIVDVQDWDEDDYLRYWEHEAIADGLREDMKFQSEAIEEWDALHETAVDEHEWDEMYHKAEKRYAERTFVKTLYGVQVRLSKTNYREINERAREAGMVRNPRWTKGDTQQPYHIPRGALPNKADVRVCFPSKGRCECTKPILQRVRRMPWGGYDKGDIAKRHGYGRWMNLVCTTHSDKKKACYTKKGWGHKKLPSAAIPTLSRKVKAVSWDSVIPNEPKADTPKAETKPEQRVEVPSRLRVVEW